MTGLLLLAAVLPIQDDSAAALARQLSSDDIAVREAATRRLVGHGAAAIPELSRVAVQADPEARFRAEQAIGEIRLQLRIRQACPDAELFDLDGSDRSVGQILQRIAAQTGAKFAEGGVELDRPTRGVVRMSRGTLMQALDLLCADLGDVRWAFDRNGDVRFSPFDFVSRPTFYSGRFRISVRRIDLFRVMNFAKQTSLLTVYLDAQAEPGVRLAGAPKFVVEGARDEKGADLAPEVQQGPLYLPGLQPAASDPWEAEEVRRSEPFSFRGPGPGARSLSRIQGRATFFLVLASEEVVLSLDSPSPVENRAFSVQVGGAYEHGLEVTLSRPDGATSMDRILDPDSIVVTDGEGLEHLLSGSDVHVVSSTAGRISYVLSSSRFGENRAKSVRFRVATELHEKAVPFEFKDIPLP